MPISQRIPEASISNIPPVADLRRKAEREIVRRIAFQSTINEAARIIVKSGWDFVDRRGILYGDPQSHRSFLESVAEGREMHMSDLHIAPRRLLCAIVDGWLRCH